MVRLNAVDVRKLMHLIATYGDAHFNAATAGTLPPEEAEAVRAGVPAAALKIKEFLEAHKEQV